MLAHEHIRRIGNMDLILVLILALIASIINFVLSLRLDPSNFFIISISVITIFLIISAYSIQKTGIIIIYSLLVSSFTFWINDIGVTGFNKILTFLLAAVIFELVFLTLKLKLHDVPLDLVIGAILYSGSIPLIVAFRLSPSLASSFPLALFNLILLAIAAGLISTVTTLLLFDLIRTSNFFIKLEVKLLKLFK